MTAFSPPADSWVIRYPTTQTEGQAKKKSTTRVPEVEQLEDPCRSYIASSDIAVKSNKSLGTDDHFKSAVCSKNLLKVCEKLMVNKEFVSSTNDSADDDFGELSLMNEKNRMDFYRKKHGNRRGSQSLPASPKLERKTFAESSAVANQNPYFTVTKAEKKTESNLGFLTSLFGITAAKPSEANANLAQKFERDKMNQEANDGESNMQQSRKLNLRANEYREMNIFSPTSM